MITSGFVAQHAEDSTKGANYLTSVLTLYDVIAEMWTFAATDFHILTKSSGFGKIGKSFAVLCFAKRARAFY